MNDLFLRALIAIGGSPELSILTKATIAMVLGLGTAHVARRVRAAVRHLLLASTFIALLTLPVALMLVPAAAIPIRMERTTALVRPGAADDQRNPASRRTDVITGPTTTERSRLSTLPPSIVLRLGWAIGTALLLGSLGISLWKLSGLRRRAYPWTDRNALILSLAEDIGLRRPVELVLHEDVAAPLTCGTRNPAIILPGDSTSWSDADVRRALVHELEHVRRNDWALLLLARVTCAVYWFHPLVWMLWRRFCLEAERACDDAVLQRAEHTDYADQLVQLARRMSNARMTAILTMAGRSDLSARVSAILDGAQKRGPVGTLPVTSVIAAAIVTTLAIAPVRAVQAPQIAQTATVKTQPRRVSGMDRALYEAAQSGDIAEITTLLNAGANVNAAIPGDGSPLLGAARAGKVDAVRFLLDQGADPNLAIPGDGSALIAASRAGQVNVVKLLLDRNADVDQVVPGDENALIQASGSGRLEVAKLLISRGANVNARVWVDSTHDNPNGEWRSPLSMARRGGQEVMVNYLLSLGAIE